MTEAQRGLLAMAAVVAAAEFVLLTRRTGRGRVAAPLAAGYGLLAAATTGNWLTGASVLVATWTLTMAADRLMRRWGPSLATGAAVVAAPYAGLWIAWLATEPNLQPWLRRTVQLVWLRLTLSAHGQAPSLTPVLAVGSAYLLCWGAGTYLSRAILHLDPIAGSAAEEDVPFRGGRMIGNLERSIVLALALTNSFAAIGFVVAAKSLVRLDLAREQSEYFLVGTLASIGWALGLGLICLKILGH